MTTKICSCALLKKTPSINLRCSMTKTTCCHYPTLLIPDFLKKQLFGSGTRAEPLGLITRPLVLDKWILLWDKLIFKSLAQIDKLVIHCCFRLWLTPIFVDFKATKSLNCLTDTHDLFLSDALLGVCVTLLSEHTITTPIICVHLQKQVTKKRVFFYFDIYWQPLFILR